MKKINTWKGRRKKNIQQGDEVSAINWVGGCCAWSFPGSDSKGSACNAGDLDSWPLGQEDPLEKGRASHSSILPGEPHRQRNLAGYNPRGHKESDTTEGQHTLSQAAEQSRLLLLEITANVVTKKCRHAISQPGLAPLYTRLWFLSAGIEVSAGCQETLGRICSQVHSHHCQNPFSFDFRAQIPVSWMTAIWKTTFTLGKPLSSPCPLRPLISDPATLHENLIKLRISGTSPSPLLSDFGQRSLSTLKGWCD